MDSNKQFAKNSMLFAFLLFVENDPATRQKQQAWEYIDRNGAAFYVFVFFFDTKAFQNNTGAQKVNNNKKLELSVNRTYMTLSWGRAKRRLHFSSRGNEKNRVRGGLTVNLRWTLSKFNGSLRMELGDVTDINETELWIGIANYPHRVLVNTPWYQVKNID